MQKVLPFFLTFVIGILIAGLFGSIFSAVFGAKSETNNTQFKHQVIERQTYRSDSKSSCRMSWKKKEKKRKFSPYRSGRMERSDNK